MAPGRRTTHAGGWGHRCPGVSHKQVTGVSRWRPFLYASHSGPSQCWAVILVDRFSFSAVSWGNKIAHPSIGKLNGLLVQLSPIKQAGIVATVAGTKAGHQSSVYSARASASMCSARTWCPSHRLRHGQRFIAVECPRSSFSTLRRGFVRG